MEREEINELAAESIVGGSIVFNAAHTTCGRNRNDQYKVLDYDAVLAYIAKNRFDMTEKTMLSNMVDEGLLTAL